MRESFGGAFMIRLVLVFIVIYVSFMAVAVNYAKAFRVKNRVINLVEQYQYQPGDQETINKVEDYLKEVAYVVKDDNGQLTKKCLDDAHGDGKSVFTPHGACIAPRCDSGNYCYYRITTYISVDFPFFNINMSLPISGETKSFRSEKMSG